MTDRLILPGPGKAELVPEPDVELGQLAEGQVRIATAYTGLSAGSGTTCSVTGSATYPVACPYAAATGVPTGSPGARLSVTRPDSM